MNSNMSKSVKNKIARKETKFKNMLKTDFNIDTVESSEYLMICNAGSMFGIVGDDIVAEFQEYGTIKNVLMIPDKPYSFIQFGNVGSAQDAVSVLNGRIIFPQLKRPIYLLYVESIPDMLMSSLNGKHLQEKPKGIKIITGFVDEAEEKFLVDNITWESAVMVNISKTLKHRLVRHYGYEFCYETNTVNKDSPLDQKIPKKFDFVLNRLVEFCAQCEPEVNKTVQNFHADQLTVNFYSPGQGIPPHVDTHSSFTDVILSLSLGSDIEMDFKHRDGRRFQLTLARRSMMILYGEVRYDWYHSIVPKKHDIVQNEYGWIATKRKERTSFTFRQVRDTPCECDYPVHCDSQRTVNTEMSSFDIDESLAEKLEEMHVHKVYEKIANNFHDTRHTAWPTLAKVLQAFKPGSIIIDVGCGNGRFLGTRNDLYEIGVDRCINLLGFCSKAGHETVQVDCLSLPIVSNVADGVMCVAVLHHLSTSDRRTKALKEIIRILRPGGCAVISVWAMEQRLQNVPSTYIKRYKTPVRQRESSQYPKMYTIDFDEINEDPIYVEQNTYHKRNVLRALIGATPEQSVTLPVHTNKTEFKDRDLLVPWALTPELFRRGRVTHLRYYHLFVKGELKDICDGIGGVTCEELYDDGNWCVVLEKNPLD